MFSSVQSPEGLDKSSTAPQPLQQRAASPAAHSLRELLLKIVELEASDLYLAADSPPMASVNGELQKLSDNVLTPRDTERLVREALTEDQFTEFLTRREYDVSFKIINYRFRVNTYFQKGSIASVIRLIRQAAMSFEELGLPTTLRTLVMLERGIILVTGATGSGKSTTLAAMIDHRNRHSTGHIITIEDPIEFAHEHKNCIVSQREVGIDTQSFHHAMKSALRQAPKVILIGEIRDSETAAFSLHASDTGHLVLSTMHTNNANQSLERLINLFPAESEKQVLLQLSLNLRGIVSQRLIPRVGGGRVVAVELLINTPRIQDLIQRNAVSEIKNVMVRGSADGMQTFDMALLNLVRAGKVTEEDALRLADSANDLKLRLRGFVA